MGISIGFGLGPLRISTSLPARRRKRRYTKRDAARAAAQTAALRRHTEEMKHSQIEKKVAAAVTYRNVPIAERPLSSLTLPQALRHRRWFRWTVLLTFAAYLALSLVAPWLLVIPALLAGSLVAQYRREDTIRQLAEQRIQDLEDRERRDAVEAVRPYLTAEDRHWFEANNARP